MSIDLDAIQARREAYMRGETSQQTIFEIVADIPALLAYARDLEAQVGRVEALAEKWERTPALRRGTSAAAIRAALTATEGRA